MTQKNVEVDINIFLRMSNKTRNEKAEVTNVCRLINKNVKRIKKNKCKFMCRFWIKAIVTKKNIQRLITFSYNSERKFRR